ncbi:uncharacterized protein MONOS_4802 [Monocercomonoides exilis]|uniref:uncharacterized protein n=1 Tax=Monocercomonoides exilis TaxID=2049356 RepID=UPI00355A7C72|nr:hypothetical protein MONOS_4802 [Monocercomonoides exilis]|eukprot:MONOS_4802.1-p1 / transcript=MONOS_4802.1 / gene=MONOS_4802 / organism=Monocercomonoides_exilis_PA203 / gene_product=unspecified product / transcript_product=unspecified product / location=Mono_scaffold00133:30705-37254(-) / protein_length=2136 / sequence_SO=supercontig / SO=protein_coding / is_pseudo=false
MTSRRSGSRNEIGVEEQTELISRLTKALQKQNAKVEQLKKQLTQQKDSIAIEKSNEKLAIRNAQLSRQVLDLRSGAGTSIFEERLLSPEESYEEVRKRLNDLTPTFNSPPHFHSILKTRQSHLDSAVNENTCAVEQDETLKSKEQKRVKFSFPRTTFAQKLAFPRKELATQVSWPRRFSPLLVESSPLKTSVDSTNSSLSSASPLPSSGFRVSLFSPPHTGDLDIDRNQESNSKKLNKDLTGNETVENNFEDEKEKEMENKEKVIQTKEKTSNETKKQRENEFSDEKKERSKRKKKNEQDILKGKGQKIVEEKKNSSKRKKRSGTERDNCGDNIENNEKENENEKRHNDTEKPQRKYRESDSIEKEGNEKTESCGAEETNRKIAESVTKNEREKKMENLIMEKKNSVIQQIEQTVAYEQQDVSIFPLPKQASSRLTPVKVNSFGTLSSDVQLVISTSDPHQDHSAKTRTTNEPTVLQVRENELIKKNKANKEDTEKEKINRENEKNCSKNENSRDEGKKYTESNNFEQITLENSNEKEKEKEITSPLSIPFMQSIDTHFDNEAGDTDDLAEFSLLPSISLARPFLPSLAASPTLSHVQQTKVASGLDLRKGFESQNDQTQQISGETKKKEDKEGSEKNTDGVKKNDAQKESDNKRIEESEGAKDERKEERDKHDLKEQAKKEEDDDSENGVKEHMNARNEESDKRLQVQNVEKERDPIPDTENNESGSNNSKSGEKEGKGLSSTLTSASFPSFGSSPTASKTPSPSSNLFPSVIPQTRIETTMSNLLPSSSNTTVRMNRLNLPPPPPPPSLSQFSKTSFDLSSISLAHILPKQAMPQPAEFATIQQTSTPFRVSFSSLTLPSHSSAASNSSVIKTPPIASISPSNETQQESRISQLHVPLSTETNGRKAEEKEGTFAATVRSAADFKEDEEKRKNDVTEKSKEAESEKKNKKSKEKKRKRDRRTDKSKRKKKRKLHHHHIELIESSSSSSSLPSSSSSSIASAKRHLQNHRMKSVHKTYLNSSISKHRNSLKETSDPQTSFKQEERATSSSMQLPLHSDSPSSNHSISNSSFEVGISLPYASPAASRPLADKATTDHTQTSSNPKPTQQTSTPQHFDASFHQQPPLQASSSKEGVESVFSPSSPSSASSPSTFLLLETASLQLVEMLMEERKRITQLQRSLEKKREYQELPNWEKIKRKRKRNSEKALDNNDFEQEVEEGEIITDGSEESEDEFDNEEHFDYLDRMRERERERERKRRMITNERNRKRFRFESSERSDRKDNHLRTHRTEEGFVTTNGKEVIIHRDSSMQTTTPQHSHLSQRLPLLSTASTSPMYHSFLFNTLSANPHASFSSNSVSASASSSALFSSSSSLSRNLLFPSTISTTTSDAVTSPLHDQHIANEVKKATISSSHLSASQLHLPPDSALESSSSTTHSKAKDIDTASSSPSPAPSRSSLFSSDSPLPSSEPFESSAHVQTEDSSVDAPSSSLSPHLPSIQTHTQSPVNLPEMVSSSTSEISTFSSESSPIQNTPKKQMNRAGHSNNNQDNSDISSSISSPPLILSHSTPPPKSPHLTSFSPFETSITPISPVQTSGNFPSSPLLLDDANGEKKEGERKDEGLLVEQNEVMDYFDDSGLTKENKEKEDDGKVRKEKEEKETGDDKREKEKDPTRMKEKEKRRRSTKEKSLKEKEQKNKGKGKKKSIFAVVEDDEDGSISSSSESISSPRSSIVFQKEKNSFSTGVLKRSLFPSSYSPDSPAREPTPNPFPSSFLSASASAASSVRRQTTASISLLYPLQPDVFVSTVPSHSYSPSIPSMPSAVLLQDSSFPRSFAFEKNAVNLLEEEEDNGWDAFEGKEVKEWRKRKQRKRAKESKRKRSHKQKMNESVFDKLMRRTKKVHEKREERFEEEEDGNDRKDEERKKERKKKREKKKKNTPDDERAEQKRERTEQNERKEEKEKIEKINSEVHADEEQSKEKNDSPQQSSSSSLSSSSPTSQSHLSQHHSPHLSISAAESREESKQPEVVPSLVGTPPPRILRPSPRAAHLHNSPYSPLPLVVATPISTKIISAFSSATQKSASKIVNDGGKHLKARNPLIDTSHNENAPIIEHNRPESSSLKSPFYQPVSAFSSDFMFRAE